jgi:hypothetical protein
MCKYWPISILFLTACGPVPTPQPKPVTNYDCVKSCFAKRMDLDPSAPVPAVLADCMTANEKVACCEVKADYVECPAS